MKYADSKSLLRIVVSHQIILIYLYIRFIIKTNIKVIVYYYCSNCDKLIPGMSTVSLS